MTQESRRPLAVGNATGFEDAGMAVYCSRWNVRLTAETSSVSQLVFDRKISEPQLSNLAAGSERLLDSAGELQSKRFELEIVEWLASAGCHAL